MFLTVIKPWKVFEPNTTLMNSHFEKKGNLVIPSDKAYITFDQQRMLYTTCMDVFPKRTRLKQKYTLLGTRKYPFGTSKIPLWRLEYTPLGLIIYPLREV